MHAWNYSEQYESAIKFEIQTDSEADIKSLCQENRKSLGEE